MLNASPKEWILSRLERIGTKRRETYLERQKSKLKNKTPSIITNTCIGGIVYHDLGLKFCSPTIDVLIYEKEYIRFLLRLEEYLQCEPIEVFQEGKSFPIGELRLEDESICLYFMHSKTFEEAKNAWMRRSLRVDLDNLYVVFLVRALLSPRSELYRSFKSLPYKNKVLLTFPVGIFDRNVVPFFSRRLKNIPGLMLKYPHPYSKKRYMDKFDFVKFFNRGCTEK